MLPYVVLLLLSSFVLSQRKPDEAYSKVASLANYANWTVDANCLQVNEYDSDALFQLRIICRLTIRKLFSLGGIC